MLWLMRAGSHATRIGSMAFSAHTRPATRVSATRVSAETSETSETPSVFFGCQLAPHRRVRGGSGNCANPLGCRYGRCSCNAVAGAVGVAESAETPLRPQAAPALIHVAALRTANAGPSPCLTGGEVATFRTVLPPCFPPRTKGSAVSGQALDFVGGAKRDRTVDLYNAIVALSQLSYGPETSGAARGIIPAPRAGNRGLAVAFALVVLDLDLDRPRPRRPDRRYPPAPRRRPRYRRSSSSQRRLLHLLSWPQRQLGRRRRCRGRRGRRRRGRAAPAPDFHEVLAIVLTAALGAFDRALVQVIEARCAILAGALGAPGRLDHAGSPGNSAEKGRIGREGGRMSRVFHPVKTKFGHATRAPRRHFAAALGACPVRRRHPGQADRPPGRPPGGPRPRARRQVGLAPRPDVRRHGAGRNRDHRPAEGEDVLCTAAALRALGAQVVQEGRRVAGPRLRRRRRPGTGRRARSRQFRHLGAPALGHPGQPSASPAS